MILLETLIRYMRTGWIEVNDTWTYSSVDVNIGVITVPTDATLTYRVGMRVRFKQGGAYKYGIIHVITATVMTIFTGTGTALTNAAITDIYYSSIRFPEGFPIDELVWTVTYSDTTDRTPAVGGPAQVTNAQIDVPIGSWKVAVTQAAVTTRSASGTGVGFKNGLSTATNTIPDNEHAINAEAGGPSGETYNPNLTGTFRFTKILSVAAKTTYYWNHRESTTASVTVTYRNSEVTFKIQLIDAYF